MISLPIRISLQDGSVSDDRVIMDIFWMKNRRAELMTLPDAMKTVFVLCALGVLLDELCARNVFADELWRGRQNSSPLSASVSVVCWAITLSSTVLKSSNDTSVKELSLLCETTAKTNIGRRYFSSFLIRRANIAKSVQEIEYFSNLLSYLSV